MLTSGNNNNEQYVDRKHQRDTNKADNNENDKNKAENTIIDAFEPDATIEDGLFERHLEGKIFKIIKK